MMNRWVEEIKIKAGNQGSVLKLPIDFIFDLETDFCPEQIMGLDGCWVSWVA